MKTTEATLRPQDVLVALKLALPWPPGRAWTLLELSQALGLSASGIHGSTNRLRAAGLADPTGRPRSRNLLEFLLHGLKYWIPASLGSPCLGLATGPSGPPLSVSLVGGVDFVWPHLDGEAYGPSLAPFHPSVPEAARRDPKLYALLSLVETLRIGRTRERALAEQALSLRLGSCDECESAPAG